VTRLRPTALVPWLLVALSLAVGMYGCGGGNSSASKTKTRYLDTSRVARAIAQSIATERHLRANVVCPQGVVQRRNYLFACLAVYHGGSTTFTVTQRDDRGNVSYAGS
jgi:hypothetical protein